jgi:hypothetical protein
MNKTPRNFPNSLDDFYEDMDTDTDVDENNNIKLEKFSFPTKSKLKPPSSQITSFKEGPPSYKKKDDVNYEQILKSMNLCVKNGKLQKINNNKKVTWLDQDKDQNQDKDQDQNQDQYQDQYQDQDQVEKERQRQRLLLLKRAILMQQEAQRKKIEEIKKIKSKKLNFINSNHLGLVEGPKVNLNKSLEILGLGKTVSVVPPTAANSPQVPVPAPVPFTPR